MEETGGEKEELIGKAVTGSALTLREKLFGQNGIPQDIYVMLIEELFRAVYVPGIVIPNQYVNFDGHDYFADLDLSVEKSRLLHDIHPLLYEQYKEQYWTQNIWSVASN